MQKLLMVGIVSLFFTNFGIAFANSGYKEIDPPHMPSATNKIEVVEIFWYGCPHCYRFKPYLDAWLQTKPDYVEFKRMPGVFKDDWLPHARAYYAAEQLGVLDSMHSLIFKEIHQHDQRLYSESELKHFFMQKGIDGDAFSEAYNSTKTERLIKESLVKAQHYQATSVPTVVINGKYLTSGFEVDSFERMIEVMNKLIERERYILQKQ